MGRIELVEETFDSMEAEACLKACFELPLHLMEFPLKNQVQECTTGTRASKGVDHPVSPVQLTSLVNDVPPGDPPYMLVI